MILTLFLSHNNPAQYNIPIFITSYYTNSFIGIDKPRKDIYEGIICGLLLINVEY